MKVIGKAAVDWWDGWLDLVITVLLWTVAQATIVLGPPATFGLYHVAHALINGESIGWRGLIEGGKRYFGVSWLWAALNWLALILIYVNTTFYGSIDSIWAFYAQIVMVMLFFIWVIIQFFTLPYMIEMERKNLFRAYRNAFFTGMAAPVFSFLLILLSLIILVLCFFFVIPVFFGLPALVALIGVRALYDRLEAYGLREREKSPKEIEREASSRVRVPGLNNVTNGEGQVKKQD